MASITFDGSEVSKNILGWGGGGTWKTMNVMFVSLDIVIFYAIQVWAKT